MPIVISQDVQGFELDEYFKPRRAVRIPTVFDEQGLEEALRSLSGSTSEAGYWFVYLGPVVRRSPAGFCFAN